MTHPNLSTVLEEHYQPDGQAKRRPPRDSAPLLVDLLVAFVALAVLYWMIP